VCTPEGRDRDGETHPGDDPDRDFGHPDDARAREHPHDMAREGLEAEREGDNRGARP
jgi:hypothetical protein